MNQDTPGFIEAAVDDSQKKMMSVHHYINGIPDQVVKIRCIIAGVKPIGVFYSSELF